MRTKQTWLKPRGRLWQVSLAIAVLLLVGAPLQRAFATGGTASFSFADNNSVFNVGGTVDVELLESGTNVQTVWANLTYPAGLLQFQQANFDNSLNTVAAGGVDCSTDPASGSGQISLRCTALTPPNGTEIVADLQFTVLTPGTAALSMVAGNNSATDITDTNGTSIWDGVLPHVTYSLKGKAAGSGSTGSTSTGGSNSGSTAQPGGNTNTSTGGTTIPGSTTTPQGPSGLLDLSVSDALGRPLGGARVTVNNETEHYTDTDGKVSFSLAAGTYSVSVTAPGMVTHSLWATVAATKYKHLSLQLSPAAPGAALGLLAVVMVAAYLGRAYLRSLRLRLPFKQPQLAGGPPLSGLIVGDGGFTPEGMPVSASSPPPRPPAATPLPPPSMPIRTPIPTPLAPPQPTPAATPVHSPVARENRQDTTVAPSPLPSSQSYHTQRGQPPTPQSQKSSSQTKTTYASGETDERNDTGWIRIKR